MFLIVTLNYVIILQMFVIIWNEINFVSEFLKLKITDVCVVVSCWKWCQFMVIKDFN